MKYSVPLLLLLIVVASCKDDTSGPSKTWTNGSPGASFFLPTIDNIWPNEDLTEWLFDYVSNVAPYDSFFTLHPTPEDVPPLPGWDDIEGFLRMPLEADSIATASADYTMRFNGLKTSGGGVTAQNLEVIVELDGAAAAGSPGTVPAGAVISSAALPADAAFLRRLYTARPDLRPKLSRLVSAPEAGLAEPFPMPTFIHGGVWEKTTQWIGTYGDRDQRLAWKFLTNDLRPGSEFTYQLVPSFADDIFLHCRIVRERNAVTAIGVIRHALECLYLVDYGISIATDPEGHPLGYARRFSYGRVVYAPTVGPVYCFERPLAEAEHPVGISEMELTLSDFARP
jgi:hypothetical protein